jgi:hypothetical protein
MVPPDSDHRSHGDPEPIDVADMAMLNLNYEESSKTSTKDKKKF